MASFISLLTDLYISEVLTKIIKMKCHVPHHTNCGGSKYPPGSFKTEGGRKTERWTTQQDGKRGARDSKPKATTEDQKQGRPRRSVMKLNYAILHKKGLE